MKMDRYFWGALAIVSAINLTFFGVVPALAGAIAYVSCAFLVSKLASGKSDV